MKNMIDSMLDWCEVDVLQYDLLEMGLFLPPGGVQKTFSLKSLRALMWPNTKGMQNLGGKPVNLSILRHAL